MRFSLQNRPFFGKRAVRAVALAAVAFLAVAESHETLLLLQQMATHTCDAPAKPHATDQSCAFCVMVGTPALVTPTGMLPLPQAEDRSFDLAVELAPLVRDTSCFPHFRRGPPSL